MSKIKLHIHFNTEPQKQFCELKTDLEPGQTATVHVHDAPEECEICPNGHCHAPNVNLTRVDENTIFLSFENFLPPMVCEIKDLPPHHIEHADEILSESELTN